MSKYSHSSIQLYLQCPLKYRYEKVDKIKLDLPQDNLNLTLGKVVHQTLEELYKKVSNMIIPSLDDIILIYKNIWDKEIDEINNKNGEDFFPTDLKEVFYNRGYEYTKYYYEKYKPFDQGIAMKTEENIIFNIDENINFSGKIDRLDIDNDKIVIIDYKTNKELPKDDYDTIQDQINLYAIGIINNYGKKIKKINGKVIYLHLKTEYEREINNDMIQKTKEKYLKIAKEIELKKIKYEAGDDDSFCARENIFCNNCIFKIMCPLFSHNQKAFLGDEIDLGELGKEKTKKIIDKYIILKEKAKDLEQEIKFYGNLLLEYANKNNFKKLYGTEKKINITSRVDFNLNELKKEELKKYLEENGFLGELLDIDIKKLKSKIKEGTIGKENIIEYINEKKIQYLNKSSTIKEGENQNDENGE